MATIHLLDASDKQYKRLGIMGGTFDPIHYGHLVLAEQIRCEYHLDKVLFIPAGHPPHKEDRKVTDNMHRYFMTLLATINNPYFEVSTIELENKEVSYTIHTIMKLKEIYHENTELYFITGADAICELDTWRDVENLFKLCNFIAGTRPGPSTKYIDTKIDELQKKYNSYIRKIDSPALAISSTDIRNKIRERQSIKYLLPESVEYYIYKNGLYL
jgi:nicotinate-nucleotide adenylyltransferase